MKVKELMDQLSQFDPEMKVMVGIQNLSFLRGLISQILEDEVHEFHFIEKADVRMKVKKKRRGKRKAEKVVCIKIGKHLPIPFQGLV